MVSLTTIAKIKWLCLLAVLPNITECMVSYVPMRKLFLQNTLLFLQKCDLDDTWMFGQCKQLARVRNHCCITINNVVGGQDKKLQGEENRAKGYTFLKILLHR